MTLQDAEKIIDNAKENDVDLELRPTYSGRGMFGRTTVGVVGSQYDIIEAAQAAGVKVSGLKWDNMGRDYIAY